MTPSYIAVLTVGLIHFCIGAAEMFLWNPLRIYDKLTRLNLDPIEAKKFAPIVANAGLYNAFLAAGLVWSVNAAGDATSLKYFFLGCVAVAGIFGAATLNWKPLILQTAPAAIAAWLVFRAGA